jgi:catechol 2,3-dioxygenase-like lactoylglutathione lyase family enzyme
MSVRTRPQVTPPPAPLRILETALYADNLDAAEDFYGRLLGLERIVRASARHVFYRCGPGVLLIFNPAVSTVPSEGSLPVPPHGARGAGHVCFCAPEPALGIWRDRLVAAGVTVEADFHWPNGARSVYVRDPAGNSVEFAEPHLWATDT